MKRFCPCTTFTKSAKLFCIIALASSFLWAGSHSQAIAADPTIIYVDSLGGVDSITCGTSTEPCQTIQYAIDNRGMAGDTYHIAGGTYPENLIIQSSGTYIGGYNPSDWNFAPHQFETIIDGSTAPPLDGDWDGRQVGKPSVFFNGTDFLMWYDGSDLAQEVQIGLATSTDGTTWTRYLGNPVLVNQGQTWNDLNSEHGPCVIKVGSSYLMYFEASTDGTRSLYRATSSDGIAWSVNPTTPILSPSSNTFENTAVGHGTVLYDAGLYRLWYHTMGDQGAVIAYAESTDGIANWINKKVILAPAPGTWYDSGVWGPSIVKDTAGDLWLFFAGAGPSNPPSIGALKSTDNGLTWNMVGTGPIITGGGMWGDPHVIEKDGNLHMWMNNFENSQIYYSLYTTDWSAPVSVFSPAVLGYPGLPTLDIYDTASEVTLSNLTITGGNGLTAGGIQAGNMELTVQQCHIHHNTADGSPNSWGGAGIISAGDLSVEQCIIEHNTVMQGAGGIRAGSGTLYVENTQITDNVGDAGIHTNGPSTITFTIIANNAKDNGMPGIIFSTDTFDQYVSNSIIYGNGGGPFAYSNPDLVHVTYSIVENGWTGTGNLSDEPLFVDADNGNYQLGLLSPGIDAADQLSLIAKDLLGRTRPLDGDLDGTEVADMGAFEMIVSGIYLPVLIK